MRIDAGTRSLYASQRPQATSTDRSAATSSSVTPAATQADGTKRADFTSMTRQEMLDLVNTQIRSGKMSLDDGFPFMAMTMKVPVDGGGELAAESDGMRYDFMQNVRDGIQGARSRNDETTLKMLQSAMSIMQRQQGQIIGVNIRA